MPFESLILLTQGQAVAFKIGTFKMCTLESEVEKSTSIKPQCNWMSEFLKNKDS